MSKEAFTVLVEMGTPLCITRNTVKVKTKNAKVVYTSGFQSSRKDVGISQSSSFIRNTTSSESSVIKLVNLRTFRHFGSAKINLNAMYTRRYLKSLFHR